MRAIWKGNITFGLVTIPISLVSASKSAEELKFNLLRRKDHSRIQYKRVAEADGKEVPWDQIVKGFEYTKGKYVVLEEEDFQRVELEGVQTVHILSFVDVADVNPIFFHKPYYMEPLKGGGHAYALLREALAETEKIGIAKVVIKTREHLAAVKPQGKGLVLELMHFADELVDEDEFKFPSSEKIAKREMQMATQLINSMADKWDPEAFHDEYKEALEKVIEAKVEKGGKALPKVKEHRPSSSKVVDLVAILQQSLDKTQKKNGARASKKKAPPPRESHKPVKRRKSA